MNNNGDKSVRKKGTTKHCAHGTCKSDSRYADKPAMQGVFFMRFPQAKQDLEKCVRWSRACSRTGFDEKRVTKDTYICSSHFVGGNGPTENHPDPIPANATKYDIQRLEKKPRRKVQRRLTLSSITIPEDSNVHVSQTDELEIAGILLSLNSHTEEKENTSQCHDDEPVLKRQCIDGVGIQSTDFQATDILFTARKIQNASSQTEPSTTTELALRINNKILENKNKNLLAELDMYKHTSNTRKRNTDELPVNETEKRANIASFFDISEISSDDKKCKFFTGLTFLQFLHLWNFLSPAVPYLQYWNRTSKKEDFCVQPQNALLMLLMRLRNGYTNLDLAYRFGVSEATVSRIILTWIQFVFKQFLPLKTLMFSERSRIRETLPFCFKKYKNIRCIIDCTEFFSQRPGNFQRQGNLYSSYKAHTTYKVLVAVAPNGAIMFTSDVFEGSITDREIVIQSGFLDMLDAGDTIMADRGFNIKDVLNERQVDMIMPPFLGGRKQFTPQEEAMTKDIAKHRIHVERSIERIKKFKLLQKTIPLSLEPVITQIVFIVGCLVNFQEPMVK